MKTAQIKRPQQFIFLHYELSCYTVLPNKWSFIYSKTGGQYFTRTVLPYLSPHVSLLIARCLCSYATETHWCVNGKKERATRTEERRMKQKKYAHRAGEKKALPPHRNLMVLQTPIPAAFRACVQCSGLHLPAQCQPNWKRTFYQYS